MCTCVCNGERKIQSPKELKFVCGCNREWKVPFSEQTGASMQVAVKWESDNIVSKTSMPWAVWNLSWKYRLPRKMIMLGVVVGRLRKGLFSCLPSLISTPTQHLIKPCHWEGIRQLHPNSGLTLLCATFMWHHWKMTGAGDSWIVKTCLKPKQWAVVLEKHSPFSLQKSGYWIQDRRQQRA